LRHGPAAPFAHRKGLEQLAHGAAPFAQGLHAAGLLDGLGRQHRELLEPLRLARGDEVGEPPAEVPGHHQAHGRNGQAHGAQQPE
jgi:hypothetical protein